MAKTESTMQVLGTRAPDFTLSDTLSGRTLSYADIAGTKATVIMFICNHCPFVKHILDGLISFGQDYQGEEVGIAAICANDADNYPDDAPDKMQALARQKAFPFPYLHDESQATARAYGAACTPDFFVYNHRHELVYRGRFDAATPGNDEPVTGEDLRAAVDALLEDRDVNENQRPSLGCNIKWKKAG